MTEVSFYDGDGCMSVSLAALGVLGNTSDEAMRVLYVSADDTTFVLDDAHHRAAEKRADAGLLDNPLRDPESMFRAVRHGERIMMRPLEISPEDVESALETYHGPGKYRWTRHTGKTKWWKDTRGKYIVSGELNTSTVLPEGKVDWIDLELGLDADNTNKHVIAVSGGRFYCKNIKKWLPTKYLWLGSTGKPLRTKQGVKGLFTTIHCVYKVETML